MKKRTKEGLSSGGHYVNVQSLCDIDKIWVHAVHALTNFFRGQLCKDFYM